mmetsp:Transcript_59341/g.70782  ORF Transcript_59341/g.70782 Transcript_59341/m.70782 type:complete len:132 (+) Transcript_59341:68-463(+)
MEGSDLSSQNDSSTHIIPFDVPSDPLADIAIHQSDEVCHGSTHAAIATSNTMNSYSMTLSCVKKSKSPSQFETSTNNQSVFRSQEPLPLPVQSSSKTWFLQHREEVHNGIMKKTENIDYKARNPAATLLST